MNTSNSTVSTANQFASLTERLRILTDGVFSAMGMGHFTVDFLNAQRPIILTFLSASLGLTNTTLAAISTGYVWAASASQPLFGWLADRLGTRWLAGLGILWMFAFFGLAMVTPGMPALVFLILASLGSAAFHPSGAMESTLVGRNHYAGRETTAASLFFFFGQMGLSLGPIVGGALIGRFGLMGLLVLSTLAVPVGVNAAWQLRGSQSHRPEKNGHQPLAQGERAAWGIIAALALVGALQAWAQQNMITFIPKYLSDLGASPAIYGIISGLFMGGSAVGNVIGGNLADRFGKQRVAMLAMLAASVPLFLIARVGLSNWLYLLVPLAGALTGSVHSIIVVLAQRRLPMGMAAASGLTLGFIFSAGALGTLFSGPIADAAGFPLVFMLTGGLVIAGAVFSLFLRGEG